MARRLSSPVFIARTEQLEDLLAAAEAARRGQPSFVLLGGEAGVGKTRLVSEVAERLQPQGWLCLGGGAVALGEDGLPFGPIVEAIRGLAREVTPERLERAAGPLLPDLARLVPELAPEGPVELSLGGQPEWLRIRAFQTVRTLLTGLSRDTPVVLVVEDVHWADRSTRDLLTYLARTARDEALLTIATFRTDELHRRHPLLPWLAEVERLPGVQRLNLRRLEHDELEQLLASILGQPPAPRLLRSIEQRSDGNPFFAEELLAASDDGSADLPDNLRDVLLVRLGSVSDAAARLAEVAAVAGPEVDHEVLVAASGMPEQDLSEPLRELLAAQLLLVGSDADAERYRFRHALVPEALYAELLPADRRRIHAAYGRALSKRAARETADRSSSLVAIAHHWLEAREPAEALPALIEAAAVVSARYAYAEAARLYEKAVELWDVAPPEARPADIDLCGLLEAAGTAAALGGDPARALRQCREAIAVADKADDAGGVRERRARVRLRLASAAQVAGDTETSISTLEEALRLLEDGPPTRARARVIERLAANLMLAGRSAESLPLAERAIEEAHHAETTSDDAIGLDGSDVLSPTMIEANALATLAVARVQTGDVEAGLETARRACELAAEVDDPWVALRAHANHGTILETAGRLEDALAANAEGLAILEALGAGRTMFTAAVEVNSATILIQLGRYREAEALLRPLLDASLPSFASGHVHGTLADAAMRLGDLERAATHLEIARTKFLKLADAQYTISHALIGVEIARWSGDPEAALRRARDGFERLSERDDALLVGPLVSSAVAAAAEVAVTADARRDEAARDDALRDADAFIGRLQASIGRLGRVGEIARRENAWRLDLCEAERRRGRGEHDPEGWADLRARTNVAERPFLAAYLLWREAEARAAGEGSAAATEALRAAHAIALRIEARTLSEQIERAARRLRITLPEARPDQAGEPEPRTPGPADALRPTAAIRPTPDPYGLTKREREVLGLLALGYTNRRIAEALFISDSTAGVHVSNILGKLGVATRTEAATIAVRLGLDEPPAAAEPVPAE
jgi:DNA-binding CsgD family transcriptional regulator